MFYITMSLHLLYEVINNFPANIICIYKHCPYDTGERTRRAGSDFIGAQRLNDNLGEEVQNIEKVQRVTMF